MIGGLPSIVQAIDQVKHSAPSLRFFGVSETNTGPFFIDRFIKSGEVIVETRFRFGDIHIHYKAAVAPGSWQFRKTCVAFMGRACERFGRRRALLVSVHKRKWAVESSPKRNAQLLDMGSKTW